MVWRTLFRYLSNNEELIRRLSESYPIRRAAQLTAYFYSAGRERFLEQRGKYERAGGWNKTKGDLKKDLTGAQGVSKEYLSNLFRAYTDLWESYKDNRRQQEKDSTSSSNATKKDIKKRK
jgi:mediator of RNA polymerase II transcription subunit 9